MQDLENKGPAWRRLEFAAVMAIAVTVLFVIIGQTAEQVASTTVIGVEQGRKPGPNFNAIDYAATGSTGQKIVIGPCDTRQP